MKTVGIIVEYNPLHNGHLYHFQQSKIRSGADQVIAVMSGHFLQRGEPAIADKWARTEMALAMGVDIVIELPVAYAVQPAEWFAYGAVGLLDATGVVDALCFGSEHGELPKLMQLAQLLHEEPAQLRASVRAELQRGVSYPAAYAAAAGQCAAEAALQGDGDIAALLGQPNNALGLHYLIALLRLQSDISPLTVARQKAGYRDEHISDAEIASATALRRMLAEHGGDLAPIAPFVPPATLRILQREQAAGRGAMSWDAFGTALFHTLLHQDARSISEHHEVTEGLEHRLKQALPALPSLTVPSLLQALKTKRYTHTKLQRMLVHILLNHRKALLSPDRLAHGISYIRVLGFSKQGQALLKRMKQCAKVPVITNVPQASNDAYLELDIRATSIYSSSLPVQPTQPRLLFRDYYEPPIRV